MSERIRIDVKLNDGNPELVEDLSVISPRARSERLKFLAQLGLMTLKGWQAGMLLQGSGILQGAGVQAGLAPYGHALHPDEAATQAPQPKASPETTKRAVSPARRKALSQLGQSIGDSGAKG